MNDAMFRAVMATVVGGVIVAALATAPVHAQPQPTTVAESESFLQAEVSKMQRYGVASSWQPVGVCMAYAKPFEEIGRNQFKRGIGVVMNGNHLTESQAAFNAGSAAYRACVSRMYNRGLMPEMLDVNYPRVKEGA